MNKKVYKEKYNEFSAQELAAGIVFPSKLTSKEKKVADEALNDTLFIRRAAMSDADKLYAKLLQVKFRMDEYLRDSHFDKNKTFGYFLKDYISTLNKKRNEFAQEINIEPTVLSQYINHHRVPPQDICIRLEIHSHKKIPATSWYRLLEKETIHTLDNNMVLRDEQSKYVVKKASLK